MPGQSATLVLPLIGCLLAPGPDKAPSPDTGFQPEVPVKQATRLDWAFAASLTPPPLPPGERGRGEGDAAKLPDSYDSTRQRYQLYVPPAYDAAKAWPLVVCVSAGDDPLCWGAWGKVCEDRGVLFCAAYGAGDNVAAGQRVRTVLDMLDDVRRRCHVDPDQTYLAGADGGGRPACAIAFALPEFFGGVFVAGEGAPLNGLGCLRLRARDRLSVALITSGKEHPLSPYFEDMGVRCRAWAGVKPDAEGPAAEAYGWLAADLDRRRTEARARPGLAAPDEAYTNLQQATLAVDAAKADLASPDQVYRGAALLEGVVTRWGRTEPADAARSLLQDLRADPRKRKKWEESEDAEERRTLAAEARLSERLGDVREALRIWDTLAAAHAETPEGKQAADEVKRLTAALAATPYLGLTVDAELVVKAVAPRGPAALAEMKAGDRLVKLGATIPATTDDLRTALQALKPGDKILADVLRDGQMVTLSVTVKATPAKE